MTASQNNPLALDPDTWAHSNSKGSQLRFRFITPSGREVERVVADRSFKFRGVLRRIRSKPGAVLLSAEWKPAGRDEWLGLR